MALGVEGWNREVLTYESGLLAALPAGLVAPRCFDVREHAGLVWLWLEEVVDEVGPPTSASRRRGRRQRLLSFDALSSGLSERSGMSSGEPAGY